MTTNTELIARLRSSKEAPYTCDAAADAIEMLEAENASITNDALKFVAERDALQAQLAAAQGQEPTGYLLPTTGKFVHAGTVMTGHAGTNWIKLYAAPIPQQPSVPEGWKPVPITPTPEMVASGQSVFGAFVEDTPADYKRIYAAILAAAPQPKETK